MGKTVNLLLEQLNICNWLNWPNSIGKTVNWLLEQLNVCNWFNWPISVGKIVNWLLEQSNLCNDVNLNNLSGNFSNLFPDKFKLITLGDGDNSGCYKFQFFMLSKENINKDGK